MTLLLIWLMTIPSRLVDRLRDDDGAISVEYGVLIAIVALGLVTTGATLTGGIDAWFQRIIDKFP